MGAAETVRVVFVDAGSGAVLGESPVPAGALPASFAVSTTLELGGATWSVERAEPPAAADVLASGELTLTLRRIELVDPREILYSLPTICADLPPTVPATGERFLLAEDDWRQVELVASGLVGEVEAQFAAIRQVYAEAHRAGAGFTRIHVRDEPGRPLRVPRSALPSGHAYPGGVGFHGTPGAAAGSFAVDTGPFVLYGLTAGDEVTVLALSAAPDPVPTDLMDLLRTHSLLLVDWCAATLVR